ncbi:MAG TPA: VOC family protein [Candidatus Kapabacteria bacterium]|nr:VOC family protein [Candidatus Kapabacteria bacterium]
MSLNHIPRGYHSITPYLSVKDPKNLIGFITSVFDASEKEMMKDDAGNVMHAEYQIGDSVVMISQARDPWPETPAAMYVYVKDVDAAFKRALASGATSIMEPADQFYGDRHGGVKDSNGNSWWIATHIEDVSPEEMKRRSEEWAKSRSAT